MTSLVNDLLTLARMDAGQTTIEKKDLDLSDVVVDTLERLTPLATRNEVILEAGNLPETRILGDRQYLLQMLSNLVENQRSYSSGDKKRVWVERERTMEAPGCEFQITVRESRLSTSRIYSTGSTGWTRHALAKPLQEAMELHQAEAGWDCPSCNGSRKSTRAR